MENYIDNYLNDLFILEQVMMLEEGEKINKIIDKLKSMNPKKLINNLHSDFKEGKLKKMFEDVKKIPTIKLSSLKDFGKKVSPDFEKSYDLSSKVIKNSLPKLPDEIANPFAAAIAFISSYQEKDVISNTKDNLKKAIKNIRDDSQRVKIPDQVKTDLAVGGVAVGTGIGLGYFILKFLFSVFLFLLTYKGFIMWGFVFICFSLICAYMYKYIGQ